MPPSPSRPRALARPVLAAPVVAAALVLRVLVLLGAAVAWGLALVLGRAPAWWLRAAGSGELRLARARAYAHLLPAPEAVTAGRQVTRRDAGRALLGWPWALLLRYCTWLAGLLTTPAAWGCATVARRPAGLARTQQALDRFAEEADAFLLVRRPQRPRLPEPDARLRLGAIPPRDAPRLPALTRAMGWTAWGADLALGVTVGLAAGVGLFAGSDGSTSTAGALAFDLAIQLGPIALALLIARRGGVRLRPADLGLHVLRPVSSAGWALWLLALYAVLLIGVGGLVAGVAGDEGDGLIPGDASLALTLAFIALATVVAPIFEEVFYRGFLFQAIRGRTGTWPAAVGSSLAFAVSHLDLDPFALAGRALIGVGLCWLLARTGLLLPGILAHAANNAVVVPLEIGWDWQIPLVLLASWAVCVLLLVPVSRWARRTWRPVPWHDPLASLPERPLPAG